MSGRVKDTGIGPLASCLVLSKDGAHREAGQVRRGGPEKGLKGCQQRPLRQSACKHVAWTGQEQWARKSKAAVELAIALVAMAVPALSGFGVVSSFVLLVFASWADAGMRDVGRKQAVGFCALLGREKKGKTKLWCEWTYNIGHGWNRCV